MASNEEKKQEVRDKISAALKLLNEANKMVSEKDYSYIDPYEKVDDAYAELRTVLHLLEDLRESVRSK